MARPRQFDEEKVLHAVREQFWNAGYAATSLEDLMRVSGLGKGSLYAAFGDKHQLFLKALRSYNDANETAVRKALESTPRAVDGLRHYLMASVHDTTGAAARRGCLMGNSTGELAANDPDVVTEACRTYDGVAAIVAEYVHKAQQQGDLADRADPLDTARALLTAQQGITYMGRAGTDVETLTKTATTLADQLLR